MLMAPQTVQLVWTSHCPNKRSVISHCLCCNRYHFTGDRDTVFIATWCGHKGDYTLNGTAITTGRFVWVAGPFSGPMSDPTVLIRTSGFLDIPPHSEVAYADKMYYDKELANNHNILTPWKGYPKTEAEALYNRYIRQHRVQVERSLSRVKHFQCLRQPWRHDFVKHQLTFFLIDMYNCQC